MHVSERASMSASQVCAMLTADRVMMCFSFSCLSGSVVIMFVRFYYSCSQNATTEPTSVTQDSTDTTERNVSAVYH